MAETATPTRISRTGVTAPPERDRPYTSRMDTSAPTKAPAGTESRPMGSHTPTSMASTAPREAPDEMPST